MSINKKLTFNSLKLFVFFIYNMAYVLYMAGYISRWINLAILTVFIFLCIYQFLYERKKNGSKARTHFLNEFKYAMFIVLSFFIISIIVQAIHHDYGDYLYSELLYNIIPPTIAFFWINTTEEDHLKKYFYIFFFRSVLYFLFKNGSNLSFHNILSISWSDSTSSVFETSLAHDFLFLEIIMLYFKKPKWAIICLVLCMLSFKRISFILALLIFIGYLLFGRTQTGTDFLNRGVGIRNRIVLFIIICLTPLLLNWMVSDSGINYFYNSNININKFTSGRINMVRYVNNNIDYYNGYGSSDYYYKKYISERTGSMHCDLLRLFYEVNMVGIIIFTYNMIQIARKNRIVFLMLLYVLMEMIASHFLDVLSVWNMFFMFAAYIYAKNENSMICSAEEHGKK